MPKHESLAAALAAFQAELPKLTKDQTAKVRGETQDGRPVNYSYGYADLSQVTEAISPVLGKHGLSFTSFPTMNGSDFGLSYTLYHESGQEHSGWWPLPDPVRTKPQTLGSAITYARRYAFMAVTNTFPGGEDDDGAAAVPTSHRDPAMSPEAFDKLPRERPTADRRAAARHDAAQRDTGNPVSPAPQGGNRPPKTSWTDEEVREMHGRIDALDLERAGAVYDWMAGKGLHDRMIAFGEAGEFNATTRLAVRLAGVAKAPDNTVANLSWVREYADGRGLANVAVGPDVTLIDVLRQEKQRLVDAAVAESDNAQALKADAAASWDDPDRSEEAAAAQASDAAAMTGAAQDAQ